MMKFWPLIALLVVFAAPAYGQNVAPTPKPTPADDDVVKISTNLIQIDVTVTDAKGKPITDLKPDEIEIYENGEKQKVSNFSFVSSVKEITERGKPTGNTGIPIPTQRLRPEQIRRTIALVVDDLSLSFESAYQTRRALKKFVDEQMQDGDLVAIVRTGAGIGALQQFTGDKRMLYAAIERVKWNPQGTGGVSAFAPIEATPETDASDTAEEEPVATGTGQSLEDFRSAVFATGTLGALKYIVTGMGELPGRKSVILFSDGFKMFETNQDGAQESGPVMDFLKQLVETANRASVVFYTVDARGLQTAGFTAADNISDTSPDAMNAQAQARRDELIDTQEGLSFLAEETGGLAIKNNNDLSGGVRRVLDDQSYYLVGYEPDADTFDPAKRKFNALVVKVLRPGATVRYRSGFFNVADREKPAATTTQTTGQQLNAALLSPFAVGGIGLRLNALFGDNSKTGPFVRSLLHINAADLKFTDAPDGNKKASFDLLAVSFGDNGQPVDQLGKSYVISVKPAAYAKMAASGFVYNFTFPINKAGAYQYRVAIKDSSGRIGSASQFIEVPDLKKKRLTLSSIILENLSNDEWLLMRDTAGTKIASDPMSDTALRRIKINSVMRYGLEIYNAKIGSTTQPQLQTKIRVFRDGKLILEGTQKPFELGPQKDLMHLKLTGAVAIGEKMVPGDYILQIIVTDTLAKTKQQIAAQFVEFEVTN